MPSFISQLPSSTPQASSFLYLGALTGSYDFDTLFAAARILIDEGLDFHIHIAGSGPLEEKWKAENGKRKLAHRITFHGFLDATTMRDLCSHCDVGLNIIRPGLHITMPHKLNDYLCAGLPVINSLHGEAEDLLNRYQAGITYTAGNPGSLADAMRQFIENQDTKKAPQNGALKLAAALLDREKTYPEWVEWLCRR